MLQFDEYKVKLNNIKPALDELAQALNLPAAEQELDMLNSESAAPGFWDDLEKSQKVTRSRSSWRTSWRRSGNGKASGTI